MVMLCVCISALIEEIGVGGWDVYAHTHLRGGPNEATTLTLSSLVLNVHKANKQGNKAQ